MQSIVDGRQRNIGHPRDYELVQLLRSWMTFIFCQELKDQSPLGGDLEAILVK